MTTLKDFRRIYGLEIIPVSTENITFGKCVWDASLFGKPKFSHGKMPDYIFLTFVEEKQMTIEESEAILQRFRAQSLQKASFFDINIEVDTDVSAEVDINSTIDLKGEVVRKKIVNFVFTEIMYKELSLTDRYMIDKKLDVIKATSWDKYRNRLRRSFMITQLYYGKLKAYIKKEFKEDLALEEKGFTLSSGVSSSSILEYVFSNKDLPFAMKLERIKTF